MKPTHILFTSLSICLPAVRSTSDGRIGPQRRILTCYHRSVVLIKIYPLRHSESFHPSLLAFSQSKKAVSINCKGVYLLATSCKCMAKCTWIWLPVSQLLKLLTSIMLLPCTYWLQTTIKSWFCVWTCMCSCAVTASIKIVVKCMWC